LLHEDDLLPETLPLGIAEVVAIGGLAVPEARSPGGCAPAAATWTRGALADGLDRAAGHFGLPAEAVTDIVAWADAAGCGTVVTPYAPVGWTADRLRTIEDSLTARGIRLCRILRPWEHNHWPHAKAGFFAFAAAVNR
jgi:deoxyribodipyrimidine photo-lyase